MKKTLHIHILGNQFIIEEDAFNVLDHFLNQVNLFIEKSKSTEKYEDSEAFFSDYFKNASDETNQVISLDVVKKAIDEIPMSIGFKNWYSENGSFVSNKGSEKNLSRCVNDKILGGVCSGIANYLGLDKTLVRLFFLLLGVAGLFVNFVGIPVFIIYIVLLIVMPKDTSTKQPKTNSKGIGSHTNQTSARGEKIKEKTSKDSNDIGRKVFGGIFFTISLAGLLGIVMAVHFVFGSFPNFLSEIGAPNEIVEMVSMKAPISILTVIILAIIGLPVILLLYASCRLLFNFNTTGRPVFFSVLLIWIILIMIPKGRYNLDVFNLFDFDGSHSFSVERGYENFEKTEMNFDTSDTIMIMLNSAQFENLSPIEVSDGHKMITINGEDRYLGLAQFTITESLDGKSYLCLTEDSSDDVEDIYEYTCNDNYLMLDKFFFLDDLDHKFHLKSILKIPLNQVVYIDESVLSLIDDIDNVENVWDGDMINQYWKMTSMGLQQVEQN